MTLRLSVFFGLAGFAFALFSGCGSSSYNGVYSGSCTGCQSSSMTMTLYQQGNNITGEWTSGTSGGGSFSGSASGSSINNCTFTSSGTTTSQGTLNLNGSTLSGSCGNVSVNLTQSQ